MKYRRIYIVIVFLVVLSGCTTVPVTGRRQLSFIPSSTVFEMSFEQYAEFLKEHDVRVGDDASQMVKRVGNHIKRAVHEYFTDTPVQARLEAYEWEFNLIENDEVNAWCMPGGKVAVYTGILAVTRNETGLAVVMGHEIAHAIAGHGEERMSQATLLQLGGAAFSELFQKYPTSSSELWLGAYGIGTQVGIMLPYSRLHEREADRLGLIFMAMAGYNPEDAVDFWRRMAAEKGDSQIPTFLSTHPTDEERIAYIKTLVLEAMQYYEPKNN